MWRIPIRAQKSANTSSAILLFCSSNFTISTKRFFISASRVSILLCNVNKLKHRDLHKYLQNIAYLAMLNLTLLRIQFTAQPL